MKFKFYLNNFFFSFQKNLETKKNFYRYFNLTYTYQDLKKYINSFLNFLNKNQISNKSKIVILSGKCFEMYASSIAVFVSNNTWIPLSKNLPIERLEKILNASKPDLLLFDSLEKEKKILINKICEKLKIKLNSFSSIKRFSGNEAQPFNNKKISPNDLSMIFFTSGSTGEPKGIKLSYENILYCLYEQLKNIYKGSKNLSFGDYHETSFVISVVIILPCIYLGGSLVPAKELNELTLPHIHLKQNKINTLITVPSTINRIKMYAKKNLKINLKILILCGEPFYLDQLDYIFNNFYTSKIFNCYGSTELSPWIFAHKCQKKDLSTFKKYNLVPIGKKFSHTSTKILSNELYISGKLVSLGYLEQKDNKKNFKKVDGKLWYKTGDIVTKINNYFIIKGRVDRIVKIKGYRVDLTEVEKYLKDHNDIDNAICFLKKDNNYAYIVAIVKSEQNLNETILLNFLKKYLPNYMLPKKIFYLKNFPINQNGKIDRKKLLNSLR